MRFVVLQLCAIIPLVNGEYVIVNTKQGSLKGQVEQSRGGRSYFAFYGIPYAEPPVGDLRFESPVPPKPWSGVRDATVLPPRCLSMDDDGEIYGDEDCLYLLLYTPKLTGEALLPVMVFIYGGAYMFGHALPNRYGPQYFMDKDVILITFHFRLGPLGFLSTGDSVLPGNYGLKDFVAVLKWVQENIEAFGGDKSRVTIAGGSSGGATAAMALISPLTKGLFHRCISHSVGGLSVHQPEQARRIAWKFASHLNCSGDSGTSAELASCLKNLPARTIIGKNFAVKKESDVDVVYGPVIEDENIPGAFLVDDPEQLLSRNSDIPWISGLNSADGGMSAIFAYYNTYLANAKEIATNYNLYFAQLSRSSKAEHNSTQRRLISETMREYFFGDSDISTNAQGYSKMITVMAYLSAMKLFVELYKGPLYAYYYDHKTEESFAKTYGIVNEDMGVIHGDELICMFNWSEAITPVTKGIDLIMSEKMLTLWTNFVAFGNPNGDGVTVWEPVKSKNIEHLFIKNGHVEMSDELLKEDSKFLEDLSSMTPHGPDGSSS